MSYAKLLLVNSSVPDYQVFLDSVNETTCAVLYSPTTTSAELNEMIHAKTNAAERIGFVFRKQDLLFEKPFLESKDYLVSLISELNTKNIDFLACNTLNDPLWKEMYEQLEKTGVVVGASSDLTGNLNYGGNWVMESTSQDIEHIYFTNTIEYYKYLLDTGYGTLFVKQDGLYALGNNEYGRLGIETFANSKIFKLSNIQNAIVNNSDAIVNNSGRGDFKMILLNNGDLYGTGKNTFGQLGDGTNTDKYEYKLITTGVSQVSCGAYHTMILKGNQLYGTGYNTDGQLGDGTTINRNVFTPITSGAGATQVICGNEHTMIIKPKTTVVDNVTTTVNELYGTGWNYYGQLGNGNTINRNVFTLITTGVSQLSCGDNYTMIIKPKTTVVDNVTTTVNELLGSGYNPLGQLGYGTNTNIYDGFTPITSGEGATQVICGGSHTMIIKPKTTVVDNVTTTVNELWGTGYNVDGRLGDGTNINRNVFTPITTGVSQVSCGYDHTMIIKPKTTVVDNVTTTVNELYGTGYNNIGQLGDGTNTNRNVFTPITSGEGATQVYCSNYTTMILKDNKLYGTGKNTDGMLGLPYKTKILIPTKVKFDLFQNIKSISYGMNHTMILLNNGDLYGSGSNSFGQLGDGTNTDRILFTPITTVAGATQVSCGDSHTMIIKPKTTVVDNVTTTVNELWGTGKNSFGQLGDGTNTDKYVFTLSETGAGATQVSCGSFHTMILKEEHLYATGYNNVGQLGDGTIVGKNVFNPITTGVNQVYCGDSHTMILKGDKLYGTGYNSFGQLGDGTNTNKSVFIPITTGVTQVSCGYGHTMILKGYQLWGVGSNSLGQLGDRTSGDKNVFTIITTGVTQVTCLYYHTIINKWTPSVTDSTMMENQLWGTGYNLYGQLGDGTTSNTYDFIKITNNVIKVKPYIGIPTIPLTSKNTTISNPLSNSAGLFSYTIYDKTIADIMGNSLFIYKGDNINIIIKQSSTDIYDEGITIYPIDTNSIFIIPTIDSFTIPVPLTSKTIIIPTPISNSTGEITYTSSNTKVATINSNVITIINSGQTTITRLKKSDGTYGYKSDEFILDTTPLYPYTTYKTTVTTRSDVLTLPAVNDTAYNTMYGDDSLSPYGTITGTLGKIDLSDDNTFNFGGLENTSIYIGQNGAITFGSPYLSTGYSGLSGAPNYIGIFPFLADLDTRNPDTSPRYIKYRLVNNTAVVIYNSQMYVASPDSNIEIKVTFYLKKHEDRGKIVIEYGNMVFLQGKTIYIGISLGTNNVQTTFTSNDLFVNNEIKGNYPIFKSYILNTTIAQSISNKIITIEPFQNVPSLGVFSVTIPVNPTSINRVVTLIKPSSPSGGEFIYSTSDSTIASISGTTLTMHKGGDVTITAEQLPNGFYLGASKTYDLNTRPLFLSPNLRNCTITIDENSTSRVFTILPATDSGGAITYASRDPVTNLDSLVATFNNNVLTLLKRGTTRITVTQAASGLYVEQIVSYDLDTSPVFLSPNLRNCTITIDENSTSRVFTILPATDSGGAITYASRDPVTNIDSLVATFNNNVLTLLKRGTTRITVTQAASGLYLEQIVSYDLDTSPSFPVATLTGFSIPMTSPTNYIKITPPTSVPPLSSKITYTSSNPNIAGIVGGSYLLVNKSGQVTITATQAAVGLYESTSVSVTINTAELSFISDICFPAGTPVETDQGVFPIEELRDETIDGKRIVYVTRTQSADTHLVCIEKDALGKNVPCQKTVMTQEHCVEKDGVMVRAADLVNGSSVYKQKYHGEKLYNVLMEEAYKMKVNNMVCETLDPENPVAKIYKDFKE